MNDKEMERLNIDDEYDINAFVGKITAKYRVPMGVKDSIKKVAREAFKLGYETAITKHYEK